MPIDLGVIAAGFVLLIVTVVLAVRGLRRNLREAREGGIGDVDMVWIAFELSERERLRQELLVAADHAHHPVWFIAD